MIIKKGTGRCLQTIIEDHVIQFEKGKTYELIQYETGEIQGRSEQNKYITVSDSGEWKFKNYFSLIVMGGSNQ